MTPRHSILIIDDHEPLAVLIASKLDSEGYDAPSCTTTKDALEYLSQHEAPTFILADRWLAEAIEVRDLEKLCAAAPASKVLVYTTKDTLEPKDEDEILRKGAYRVLDKSVVDDLIANIKVLTTYLEELLELAAELNKKLPERSKIMAALVGSGVEVTVVDKYFHTWFNSSGGYRSTGACRDSCRAASLAQAGGPVECWGCTISEVFRHGRSVDGLYLNRFPDGSVRWVAVRSTPILGSDGKSIIAVREATTHVGDAALAEVPQDQRLHHIAEGLVRHGFGRVRIYQAVSPDEIKLVSAAASTDSPHSTRSDYRESIGEPQINVSLCPYTRLARDCETGCFVERWDSQMGHSPFEKPLDLHPPYFDVPIWRDDKTLEGWIAVDFGGLEKDTLKRAVEQLARKETLGWLQEEYGWEVRRAFESSGGKPGHRDKFKIAQDARFGIANAKSVEDATRALQDSFAKLFPKCRVSVRMRSDGALHEFESLCTGVRDGKLLRIVQGDDPQSLSAYVAATQMQMWISDYEEYRRLAPKRGDPSGYPREGTLSTAQIPLRFENTVFGTLSVDSPETIRWDEDGYKEPLLALAKDTALVLRDLILHEEVDRAMAVRAALTAYSVSVSGDALWRHWAQQRLAEATVRVGTARGLLAANDFPNREAVDDLLVEASDAITSVHSARPDGDDTVSWIADIFGRLKEMYATSQPLPIFDCPPKLPCIKIPPFILRSVLMVLLDNAIRAVRTSGTRVTVTARLDSEAIYVEVEDDGPGVPAGERSQILRQTLKSTSGLGLGLLYARGAALQYGGELTYQPSQKGAHFTLMFPSEDRA